MMCQKKMREIIAKDKEGHSGGAGKLITLEVCYEFYLRGFHFERLDLYKSQAHHFAMVRKREL